MSAPKLTMAEAIAALQRNDSNATWDECETLDELRTGLRVTIEAYEAYEECNEQCTFLRDIETRLVPSSFRIDEPDHAGTYDDDSIRALYREVDPDDYNRFDDWLYDMVRMGIINVL